MKWKEPGHEYDKAYDEIKKIKRYYLFGAGDYGRQFADMMKEEIEIVGYIDNNIEKQGKYISGYPCYSLQEVFLKQNEAIIVTMSQIARIKPIEQLKEAGYIRDISFFVIEEFISIYYVYKHNKVYFSSISFLPSTVCNLNCRNCLNFNPFAKQFYVREWEDLKEDVDLFFSCVDYIMLFHVSGGEPMLYKHTADLLEYIDKKYGSRIGRLRTVTNGTIVPKDEVLERLSRCNVEITIDDYREAVPKFRKQFDLLIDKFEEYHIKYYINKVENWIDLAPERTDYSLWSEEKLENHRTNCNQSWQELRGGKIYNCSYASYATVAGIAGDQDLEEVYDLITHSCKRNRELIEFRLGYSSKGYTEFCKKCRGFTTYNEISVKAATQVEQRG